MCLRPLPGSVQSCENPQRRRTRVQVGPDPRGSRTHSDPSTGLVLTGLTEPTGLVSALTKASTTNMSVYSSRSYGCSPGYSTGLDPDRTDPWQGAGPKSRTRPAVTWDSQLTPASSRLCVCDKLAPSQTSAFFTVDNLHRILFLPDNTKTMTTGTAMEIRQYTLAVLAGNVRSSSQAQLRG